MDRVGEARRLRGEGWSYTRLARRFAVSFSTVRRWCDEEVAEADRARSRAYKERHRGVCEFCGDLVWMTSWRCARCASEQSRVWSDEELLERLRAHWRETGRSPTANGWRTSNGGSNPPLSVYQNRFGSWNVALALAGLPINRRGGPHVGWDRGKVVRALREWAAEHGRPPTSTDWAYGDPDLRRPTAARAAQVFGSWGEAREAAFGRGGGERGVGGVGVG